MDAVSRADDGDDALSGGEADVTAEPTAETAVQCHGTEVDAEDSVNHAVSGSTQNVSPAIKGGSGSVLLDHCPKQFIVARYLAVLAERAQLQEQLRGLRKSTYLSGVNSSPVSENPSSEKVEEIVCAICLDSVECASFSASTPITRAVAKLACGHIFHLECIALAHSVKQRSECPSCRSIESSAWLFGNEVETTDHAQAETSQSRLNSHTSSLESHWYRERVRQQQALLERLLERTLGALPASTRSGQSRSAVLVPVPAVPVDSLEEMRAFSTGAKRSVFMPVSYSASSSDVLEQNIQYHMQSHGGRTPRTSVGNSSRRWDERPARRINRTNRVVQRLRVREDDEW